ncbi:MAG: hypothetical protein JWR35_3148 [Marmoricola sp.]|jgi:glycosyltransferase involved in cell wall biosynthesis|nr:hypothetical protein [Marmoricola sp.]
MQLTGKRVVVANWRDLDHSLAGGAEHYAWEFARALRDAGAQVDFISAREPGQPRREHREGVRILRGGGQFTFYLMAGLYLLLHRRRLDVVVDADCGIPVFSPLFVSRRRTGIVLLVHHVHLEQFRTYFPAPLAWFGRFLEGTVMPRVYSGVTTVAVSDSTRREMVEQLGWQEPVGLLANGNTPTAPVTVDAADTVDRLVVLGRLAPHKRVDLVIRAVAALSVVRPTIQLDVIGKGPDLARLAGLVGDLEIEKHVTLHGYLDQQAKEQVMSRARLHVCASDVEGWGQVVIEAASYGVPTVARNVPGLRDSVRDTRTGWLLDEPSVDLGAVQARLLVGIGTALIELEDDERREEVAGECRAWSAGFTWDAMHEGAVAIVKGALLKTSSSPSASAETDG